MASSEGWAPVQRLRTYEQVMHQIEERILAGELSAGDHLPSERDLAILLSVSRPSLRESLRVLEALGLLDIRRGGGPDGGAVLLRQPGDGLVNLLRLQFAIGHFTHRDLLETRIALETWSCAEAASRASEEDLVHLEEILTRMDAPDISTTEWNSLDTEFHVAIASSTGNAFMSQLMSAMRLAIQRQMIDAYARLDDWRAVADSVRSEHRGILDALIARDAAAASARVQQHIRSFYSNDRLGDFATPL